METFYSEESPSIQDWDLYDMEMAIIDEYHYEGILPEVYYGFREAL